MADYWSGAMPSSRLQVGTRLNGIYEIDARIATGGMGEIYRGHAVETGHAVAIKVMRTDLADNASALALFRKEAKALFNLQHDAIVRYYAFSSDPVVRRHYLAMEFVEGRPLLDLLREGALVFEAVRALQQRLAAGLHAAHQHGIIHRDVSPDNILIPGGDVARAKIIDFGIARSTKIGDGTIIGSGFAGKFNYVSPEQLGLFGGNVTAKSDIYSLGLVLAECLSGQPIDMGGSQLEVLEKRRVPPNLGAVDLRYLPLLEHMLQPDPHDRPESMAAVAAWRPDVEYRARRNALVRGRAAARGARTGEIAEAPQTKKRPRIGRWLAFTALALVMLAGLGSVALAVFFPYLPALSGYVPKVLVDWMSPPPPPASTPPPLSPARPPLASAPTLTPAPPLPPAPSLTPTQPAPPAPAPIPQPVAVDPDTTQRIGRFLDAYQSGDCFFAAPATSADNRSAIDALFALPAALDAFKGDYRRAVGGDANVIQERITTQQCAVPTFLTRLRSATGPPLRLDLATSGLRSGATMTGSVTGIGDRQFELLLVADDGLVYSMTSRATSAGADSKTFGFAIKLVDPGAARPQLVVAVASSRPLGALKPVASGGISLGAADQLFPRLLNEARQPGQVVSASTRYFRLEN
jgi:eukaryotic-like serine/threonine-protein kinase